MRDRLMKYIRPILLGGVMCFSGIVLGQTSGSINTLPAGQLGSRENPLVCNKGETKEFSIEASTNYDLGVDDYKNDRIQWTIDGGISESSGWIHKTETLTTSRISTVRVKWSTDPYRNSGFVDVTQTSVDASNATHCSGVVSRIYVRLNNKPYFWGLATVDRNECADETSGRWNAGGVFDFSGVNVNDVDTGDTVTKSYKIVNESGDVVEAKDIDQAPSELVPGVYRVYFIASDGYSSSETSIPVYNITVNRSPRPSNIRY